MYALDAISERLCKVVDPAELCRQLHPHDDYRVAAHESVEALSKYIYELNTNTALYKAVAELSTPSNLTQFLEEERTVISLLKQEFEVSGVHLPTKIRQQVVDLERTIGDLSLKFMQNAQRPPVQKGFQGKTILHLVSLSTSVRSASLEGLPQQVKRQLSKNGDMITILNDVRRYSFLASINTFYRRVLLRQY